MSLFIYLFATAGATAVPQQTEATEQKQEPRPSYQVEETSEAERTQPNQVARPVGYATNWISRFDYPPTALAEKREGRSEFQLNINKWGTATDCVITKSSGHTDLDDAACQLIVFRSRFSPATDAGGKPIAGEYSDSINWSLPKPGRQNAPLIELPKGEASLPIPKNNPGSWVTSRDYPAAALVQEHEGAAKFTLNVDKNGRVTKCEIVSSSGYSELDAATCRAVSSHAAFQPATDEKGKSVASLYTNTVRWQIPYGPTQIPQDTTMTTSFIVEANGVASNCKLKSTTTDDGKWTDCPWPIDQKFEPRLNADGKAIPVRIITSTVIKVVDGDEKNAPND